jgi:hypothetical protein
VKDTKASLNTKLCLSKPKATLTAISMRPTTGPYSQPMNPWQSCPSLMNCCPASLSRPVKPWNCCYYWLAGCRGPDRRSLFWFCQRWRCAGCPGRPLAGRYLEPEPGAARCFPRRCQTGAGVPATAVGAVGHPSLFGRCRRGRVGDGSVRPGHPVCQRAGHHSTFR